MENRQLPGVREGWGEGRVDDGGSREKLFVVMDQFCILRKVRVKGSYMR